MNRFLSSLTTLTLLVVGLVGHGPALVSHLWSDIGLIRLNRMVFTTGVAGPFENTESLERAFTQAVAWDEGNPGAHKGLALIHAVRGDKQRSIREWQAAGMTGTDLMDLAEESARARRYLDALWWYNLVEELQPSDPKLWLGVGRICKIYPMIDQICVSFLLQNQQNWLVDPGFVLGSTGWYTNRQEDAVYEVGDCPDLAGIKCARVAIADVIPKNGASWYQCLRLFPGQEYRFAAWIKVEADTDGRWRPLYYQGDIDGEPRGHWPGNQTGPMDWKWWERIFVAPAFDDNLACFHPLHLESRGQAWFHSATLTLVRQQSLEDFNGLWRMNNVDETGSGD